VRDLVAAAPEPELATAVCCAADRASSRATCLVASERPGEIDSLTRSGADRNADRTERDQVTHCCIRRPASTVLTSATSWSRRVPSWASRKVDRDTGKNSIGYASWQVARGLVEAGATISKL
jgi:hypothetical protein